MSILKKFKEAISNLSRERAPFDPSTLNDEVALKTEWGPLRKGGTSICTHRLKEISPSRVEFKTCSLVYFFLGMLLLVSLGLAIGLPVIAFREDDSMLYFGIPAGIIFFLAGCFMLHIWMPSRIFDLNAGYYWKGGSERSHMDKESIEEYHRLNDIHAVQLIHEHCGTGKSGGSGASYLSYELNLILKGGSRVNIVDHGDQSRIRTDAEKLSRFLNVPLWDATLL